MSKPTTENKSKNSPNSFSLITISKLKKKTAKIKLQQENNSLWHEVSFNIALCEAAVAIFKQK